MATAAPATSTTHQPSTTTTTTIEDNKRSSPAASALIAPSWNVSKPVLPITPFDDELNLAHNYDSGRWHQCFFNTSQRAYSLNDTENMYKLLDKIESHQIAMYVMATYRRRPRFFNLANCSFPFRIFLICEDYYYFDGYSYRREMGADIAANTTCFGAQCQFYDLFNFYKHIYDLYAQRNETEWILLFEVICEDYYYFDGYSYRREMGADIAANTTCFGGQCQFYDLLNFYKHIYDLYAQRNETEWILLFEDDVEFCPLTPQYILNVMRLAESDALKVNMMHLSRGNVGTMMRVDFIPTYLELLSTVNQLRLKGTRGFNAVDVGLTVLMKQTNNWHDIYYTKYNMMHHPKVSLNVNAQQHIQGEGENVVSCDKLGMRWNAKELLYLNPYTLQVTFEHLK
eukprot:CAMPEP_0197073426 /NCGR_PEP_ID=MMETSP1384-20130603/210600_1 /TAXON_ID=29189 /ORGANISM="Ammonia sp." /LENGTH=398 /DNA_ID=CAMNT_0042512263 /DNA_START=712 /DNA_END=1908 /DNA_ORIENTATION=-